MESVWRNWSGDQICNPAAVGRAQSLDDVRRLVGEARGARRTIRAAGSGHSFTDVACTDGLMVRIDELNRILDVDSGSGLVKVEAGITLHDLNELLWDEHNLALRDLGDIDKQTLAGAISTSTHGTGTRSQTLASQIEAIELVTADGNVRELTVEDDLEEIRAARVALGTLGIITSVTLRCVPAFTLQRHDHALPLDDALARFEELGEANDHFEFYVFPHTETALCRETKKVEGPPQPWSGIKSWWEETLLENHAMGLVSRTCRRFPSQIPRINKAVAGLLGGTTKTDRSYRVYASVRNVRFTEMEYAIPREHVGEALRSVLELIPRRGYEVGFPIEVRALAADDAFLSTASGRATAYIAVHMYKGMIWEPYFRAVETIMNGHQGRPHWGKRHFQTAETLAPRYPDWDRFQAVRESLDPSGLFANEHTDRVLGPAAVSH